jgi:pimeloyl-ACP methyl ester carboxylesterase
MNTLPGWVLTLLAGLGMGLSPLPLRAANPQADAGKATADKAAADKPAEKAAKKGSKIPDPKTLRITSKDGLQQIVSYYQGLDGKESVPVILLHDQGGKRDDLKSLAMFLQEGGMAVVVPDLRGHGGSTTIENPRTKKSITLNNRSIGRNEITNMVKFDLEAIKEGLIKKEHNATPPRLNMRKLCVLGVGMGATVAINWAAQDWDQQDIGGRPQGKDVLGLILIAPALTYKGVPINNALDTKAFRDEISFLILAGSKDPNDKTYEATVQFQKRLAKSQTPKKTVGPSPKKDDEKPTERLVFKELPTTLQGTKLLQSKEKSLNVMETIDEWITQTVGERTIDWEERK